MTSQTFEAALDEPDNDASHLRLQKLVATRDFRDPKLPAVAEKYLRAFCNMTSSFVRRRWIGIALAGMIDTLADVVEHLKLLRKELHGLGTILLSNTELEETKIIAGIIMRQGIEQGIEFASFWVSNKIKNSAPNFPENSGPKWMSDFQDFLDTLDELALADTNSEPSIIYPIALVASDGFRWRESNDSLPIALIQAGMLTIIAPDGFLREIQFVDVPITHIHSIRSLRSTLHDSQAQRTGYEPWNLTLTLRAELWTYCLNASRRTGTEVTLLFQHVGDAKEWENCIKEHLKGDDTSTDLPPKAHPTRSSSSPLNSGLSPPNPSRPIVWSSDPINASHSGLPARLSRIESHLEQEDNSSEQLSESPQSYQTGSSNIEPVQEQHKTAPMQREDNTKPSQEEKRTKLARAQHKTRPAQGKAGAKSTQQQHEVQPVQGLNPLSSEDMPDGTISSEESLRICPTSKRTMSDTGKLPSVSQATKLKASRPFRAQIDVFGIPGEKSEKPCSEMKAGAGGASSPRTTSHKQSQRSKVATHKTTSGAKGVKSRSKRKADDDDDFVPDGKKPRRKTNTKRRSGSDAIGDTEQPRKKARIGSTKNAKIVTGEMEPTKVKTAVQYTAQVESTEAKKPLRPQRTTAARFEKPPSSIVSSRQSVIGKLLNSQLPSQPSAVPFKKPKLPIRTSQTPSTPTQPKSQSIRTVTRPQTPTDIRKRPNDEPLPHISSSPPLGNGIGEASERRQHAVAETEILSSNSKPVPASPNAESTAISGHADCDDVDLEKKRGDIQTAKSDPFRQRRAGQKATSFTRRLTGEDPITAKPAPKDGQSHSMPIEIGAFDNSDIDEILLTVASQPLPQHMLWQTKKPTHSDVGKPVRKNLVQVTESREPAMKAGAKWEEVADYREDIPEREQVIDAQASQSSKRNSATKTQGNVDIRNIPTHNHNRRFLSEVAPIHAAPLHEEVQDVDIRDTNLTAPQQAIDNTQFGQSVQDHKDLDMDGDTTLVNYDEDEQAASELEASKIRFCSSPPVVGSPSSHSSTSAEFDPSSQPLLPTSEAEEMEWEASLQPHQRAIHDLLIRTSKRVLRQIVDNETAVTDIAEIFARDGEHVLNSLLQRHDGDYDHVFQDMENKTRRLKKDLETAAKQLAKERKRVNVVV